jgi:single-strand DNA-binding protein
VQGFNQLTIAGNISQKPEVKHLASGETYLRFSVAVGRKWEDAQGHTHQAAEFFQVTLWGKRGQSLLQYIDKGSPVLVTGELTSRVYDSKDMDAKGKPIQRRSFEVRARDMVLLPSGKPRREQASDATVDELSEADLPPEGMSDDSIPF